MNSGPVVRTYLFLFIINLLATGAEAGMINVRRVKQIPSESAVPREGFLPDQLNDSIDSRFSVLSVHPVRPRMTTACSSLAGFIRILFILFTLIAYYTRSVRTRRTRIGHWPPQEVATFQISYCRSSCLWWVLFLWNHPHPHPPTSIWAGGLTEDVKRLEVSV